jgi:hypothetical protein
MRNRVFRTRIDGFSLVEVMVAAFVAFLVAAGISAMMKGLFRASSSSAKLGDLSTLKMNIRDALNCEKTLGVVLPAVTGCGGPYTLRRADNSVVPTQFGSPATWEIRSRCVANSLIVEAHQIGAVPSTPGLSSVTHLRRDWFDLFNGTSDFCKAYFVGPGVCPAPQTIIGMAGSVPVCGLGTWPNGPYCIIQAQNQACPTGFTAQDPSNSNVPGNGLVGESFLVRGDSSSHISVANTPWQMNTSFNGPVITWAWCCK